ncbi:hypothetical protein B0T14DRAFT_533743 [Immersiella caudata]|uniref:Uncharacterized protein n=1 Tax=Immersiella caudata TaxID=314043 RepID=A0AA40CDL7_9PEZI|nr:hypothetical protein B0T14DRAFT_533743 [Immersiella caudata]
MSDKGQFEPGFQNPITFQGFPGKEGKMPSPKPWFDEIPTEEGGSQKYKLSGKLTGKKAIITGGDSGIGRATAVLFATQGVDSLIRLVESYGHTCHLLATDLTSQANCHKVVDTAAQLLNNHIDILFNNATFQLLHTFNNNIYPYFYLAKYALPSIKRGSTIISNAKLSNYQVGKGIRVIAIALGLVVTPPIPATLLEEAQKSFTSPMGRPAQPSEIATCVLFLTSMDSSAVSRQVIHCNGGTIVNG